jgi:hypothetical protein
LVRKNSPSKIIQK